MRRTRADRRQRDVGDREIEVRDGRHEDQRNEDQLPALGTGRSAGGEPAAAGAGEAWTALGSSAMGQLLGYRVRAGGQSQAIALGTRGSVATIRLVRSRDVPARWCGTGANTRRHI